MKVIGVEPSANCINWIALDGHKKSGHVQLLSDSKILLPATYSSEVENYLSLKEHIRKYLKGFDKICIIQAGKDSSASRAKIELMIQYAAHESGISSELIHPTKISWAIKKTVVKDAGRTLEEAFNNGDEISPKYLRKCAYCAWCGLP